MSITPRVANTHLRNNSHSNIHNNNMIPTNPKMFVKERLLASNKTTKTTAIINFPNRNHANHTPIIEDIKQNRLRYRYQQTNKLDCHNFSVPHF